MSQEPKTEFQVAEEIRMLLEGLPAEKRELAMRWARESLGMSAPSPAPHEHTQGPPSEHGAAAAAPRAHKKSLRDFVHEKRPKSDTQFAAVVAYFHQFEAPERCASISSADLQEAARLSNRARFTQPTVTMNNAIKQGLFDRAERGSYKLNTVGENLVAMALPDGENGEGAAQRSKRVRRRRDRVGAAGARQGRARKAR